MSLKPYKLVRLQQGSLEWSDWRQGKIGASDSPIIMGKSPYKSAYDLYLEMTGLLLRDAPSASMQYGHEMETLIRSHAEKELGMDFTPMCIESNNSCFIASLDGLSWDELIFIEAKANNRENHKLAKSGKIPESHYIQMQHQFGVLGHNIYRKAYYVSYHDGDFAIVEVNPNTGIWDEIVEKGKEFWDRVVHKNPPPLTDRDYPVIDEIQLVGKAEQLKIIQTQRKELEKQEELLRKEIIDGVGRNARIGELTLSQVEKKGAIQYTQIPELTQVDLERYRAAPTKYWTLR